jgi:hypothetical protein
MSKPKGNFKTRKDFTDKEWAKLVKKALRLANKRKWGRIRISKELNLSPNTIEVWINKLKTPHSCLDIFDEDRAFDDIVALGERIVRKEGIKKNIDTIEAIKIISPYLYRTARGDFKKGYV